MTKLDPWTVMARFKLMVEDDLPTVPGLNYVVLRPAIVYGIGDKNGLSKSVENIFLLFVRINRLKYFNIVAICIDIYIFMHSIFQSFVLMGIVKKYCYLLL